jgi:hypothetical protein
METMTMHAMRHSLRMRRCLKTHLSSKQGTVIAEQRAKIFHGKMPLSDVRGAVRHLTERDEGGVTMPDDIKEKTGDSVAQVSAPKRPDDVMTLDALSLTQCS